MELTIFTLLAIYLKHVSAEDISRRKISNFAPIIIMMSCPFLTTIGLTDRLIGLLGVFLPMLLLNRLVGVGMGDVKLCGAFGFALGAIPTYIALLTALITAAIGDKLKKYDNGIPFAPYICGAALGVYIIMEVLLLC